MFQLELSGFVFTAECLLMPCFNGWLCAQFPCDTVLLLSRPTALAGSRSSSFQVTEHSDLHPDLMALPLACSLRLEGLTARLCHQRSLHRTDLPISTLTKPLGGYLLCFHLNNSLSFRHLNISLLLEQNKTHLWEEKDFCGLWFRGVLVWFLGSGFFSWWFFVCFVLFFN